MPAPTSFTAARMSTGGIATSLPMTGSTRNPRSPWGHQQATAAHAQHLWRHGRRPHPQRQAVLLQLTKASAPVKRLCHAGGSDRSYSARHGPVQRQRLRRSRAQPGPGGAVGCTLYGQRRLSCGPGVMMRRSSPLRAASTCQRHSYRRWSERGLLTTSSPAPYSHNTSILKLDWTPQRCPSRVRCAQPAEGRHLRQPTVCRARRQHNHRQYHGIAAGDTWTINAHLGNDIRYGYTRQAFGQAGLGSGSYTDVRGFIAIPQRKPATRLQRALESDLGHVSYKRPSHTAVRWGYGA